MRIAILLLILLFVFETQGQTRIELDPSDEALLDSLCLLHLEETKSPGFAVGIVSKGKVLYTKGFGVRNLKTQAPVTEQSVFHMASVSKTFVATAIAQLVAQNKLALDDLLIDHLPYFELKDMRYKQITIRHMLTHTSGIPDVINCHWNKPVYDSTAIEDYVRNLSYRKLDFDPGSDYKYSSTAFNILADVIAKASGMPFESYMKHFILEPAGMENSTFFKPEVSDELATSPHISLLGIKKVSSVYPYSRVHAGSGTLNSNAEDMARYALTYLNKGRYGQTEVFDEATYDLITTKQRTLDKWRDIGLSWFISASSGRNPNDRGRLAHSGGDRGYSCWLGILPEKSWAMITLYNCDWRNEGSHAIFDAAYDMAERYD